MGGISKLPKPDPMADELEKKYDTQFKVVFDAIRELMAPPPPRRRRIGFRFEEGRPSYRRPRRVRASAAR